MIDDRDPLLTRLFAEDTPPGHGSDFMAQFSHRLERHWRKRRVYRIGMTTGIVIVAALLAPWIAQLTAAVIASLAAGITATRPLLNFPMAWLVVSSMVASVLPVIYLGITRRW